MACQNIILTLIFCLVAFAGVNSTPANFLSQKDRFTINCLNDSVVVTFKQLPLNLNVRMYTNVSLEFSEVDSDCSRTFTRHEPVVKEFNFKKCNYGSRQITVHVDEFYKGKIVNSPIIQIDCKEVSVGDALGSVIAAYIDILGR